MTLYEMEEQLKNLDARVNTIGQILPMLATRQDLRDEVAKLATKEELRGEVEKLATRDDLQLTTRALQHEIEAGFQEAKTHADGLNEITREQIRLLTERTATKEDLRDLRHEIATKEDLRDLRHDVATKGDLQQLQRTVSAQIASLGASRGNKKR